MDASEVYLQIVCYACYKSSRGDPSLAGTQRGKSRICAASGLIAGWGFCKTHGSKGPTHQAPGWPLRGTATLVKQKDRYVTLLSTFTASD